MLTVIIFLLFIILVLGLARLALHLQEVEKENELQQAYLASTAQLYDVLKKRIEQKRKYRHDLAKHIRTLEEMMDRQAKQEELSKYLSGLKEQYHAVSQQRLCGDDLVDAVLSVKMRQCEQKQISLLLDVQDCMYGEIEDIDLVGILENLLDNALEAQEKISDEKERQIKLTMRKEQGEIRIAVENTICTDEDIDLKTKKKYAREHGLGLQIIDRLVKKTHGTKTINIDQNSGLFLAQVMLDEGVHPVDSVRKEVNK